MCAAGNLWTHQARLCMEGVRIYFFQSISAEIIVSVSGGTVKALRAHFVFLHCQKDFHLVIFRSSVKLLKSVLQCILNLTAEIIDLSRDPKLFI